MYIYICIYIYIYIYPPPRLWRRRRSWTFLPEGHLPPVPPFLPFKFLIKGPEIRPPRSRPPSPGHLLDLQDASKTPPRCLLFAIIFWMFFCIDFQSIFDANLAPTCLRKSMKIHEKSMPRAIPILHSFFYRFLIDFCSIFRSLEPQMLLKLYRFYSVFLLFGLFKLRSILFTS